MKRSLSYFLFALCFGLAVSNDASGQAADPRTPRAPLPAGTGAAGGAAAGAVATPLPVEQRIGGTPQQTAALSLVAGIAGFAAAAASGSTSANH